MTNSVVRAAGEYDNPFSCETAATGKEFAGREREIAEIYISIRSWKNAVLYSDKKMGKSSILAELAQRYSNEFEFVTVNLRGVSDEGRFIELLTRETLKTAFSGVDELVPAIWELLNSARLRLAVLEDGTLGIVSKSEAQAIILSPRGRSPNEAESDDALSSTEIRICTECGKPLRWIEKYKRHYCYGCKRYAPQRRTTKYHIESPNLSFPRRVCPECGGNLTYIEKFGEHYCNQCKRYPLMEHRSRRLSKSSQEDIVEALDLPERIAMQKKKHLVVMLDDFQETLSFDSGELLKSMRARFEVHSNVSYVFSGSGWRFLDRLFVQRNGAFFRFAHPIALGPLPRQELQEFLVRRFRAGGGKLTSAWASKIAETTACHPYYAQLVAHELFHISKTPDAQSVETAIGFAVARNAPAYTAIWESVKSPLHKRYLIGAAMEPNVPHGASFIRRYGLKSRSHVQRIQKQLEAREIIRGGDITDPFFMFWLRGIASS